MQEILKLLKDCGTIEDTNNLHFIDSRSLVRYLIKKGHIDNNVEVDASQLVSQILNKRLAINKQLQARSGFVKLLTYGIDKQIEKLPAKFDRTKRNITSGSWPVVKVAVE